MFKPKSDMVREVLASLKAKSSSKEKDYSEEEDSSEGSENAGLEAAAEDIMSAMSSKDPAALVEALKAFIEQC